MLHAAIGFASLFKMFIAFIGVAVLALGGAVLLLIWISSMTPIHVTEEREPAEHPPTAEEWVEQGAVLLIVGEVGAVYGPEWSTSDGSRPGTPWEVSGVPDDTWIQTPILVDLTEPPVLLQGNVLDEMQVAPPEVDLLMALRGGEIGEDRYEIIDGQDRTFEPGDQVALLLSVKDRDVDDPDLIGTQFGEGWEFVARYRVENDTAVLHWGDQTIEQSLDELIQSFEQAAR